jgi:hypothetical protein
MPLRALLREQGESGTTAGLTVPAYPWGTIRPQAANKLSRGADKAIAPASIACTITIINFRLFSNLVGEERLRGKACPARMGGV